MLTTKLISNIKRRVTMPANQRLMDDDDILEICDTVIMEKMIPEIISLRQNYFVTTSDISLTEGVDSYPIPYRAMGRTLRDLKVKFTDGSKSDLSLLDVEDEHLHGTGNTIPSSFYFKGDKIVLVPPPCAGLSLEVWWEMPPSRLIKETNAAKVASVVNDSVTVVSLPSDITSSVDVDIIDGKPGFCTYAYDMAISSISGNTINFNPGALDNITVSGGDYITLVETSPLVQLPRECAPFLETLAARRVLQAIGDFEGLKMLSPDEEDDLKQMRRLLEPRIRGEATKIIHRKGLLRGSGYRFRRGVIY